MVTVSINDKYVETLKSFTDIQTATDTALRKYLVDLISTKIVELSTKNTLYTQKYSLDFSTFSTKVSSDENFITNLEQDLKFKNWENDLIDWEFNYKGIDDWKLRLQNILTT